ncbi:MAG: hypothetical protein EXR71_12580 [Myxococcales bacterium]|nr:hypothetical protein [Myxococcales bacterium]
MRASSWLLLLAACAPPSNPEPAAGWSGALERRLLVADNAIDLGSYSAHFPAQGTTVRFTHTGASARSADGGLVLSVGAMGRGSELVGFEPVEPSPGDAVPGLRAPDGQASHRVEYARAGLTEWFAGVPEGLEHGWLVHERPAGDGRLQFALRTDAVVLDVAPDTVALLDDGGGEWRYAGLYAWDANGLELPTRFRELDGSVVVEVDDRGAAYPVEVDPVLTTAATTLTGPSAISYFGYAVAGAGDVNADGFEDVVVGAYGASTRRGRAYVYHGSASGLSSTATTTLSSSLAYFCGGNVAGGGDVNDDGYDDVVIACTYNTGLVQVFHGSASGVSTTASTTITSSSAVRFGYGLALVPSIDGDAYDDVLVGAPAYSSYRGRVSVYAGGAAGISSTASLSIDGPASLAEFGQAISTAGDVDGDGYGDVVVGAPGSGSSAGRGAVYYGSASGLSSSDVTAVTGTGTQRLGTDVAGGSDIDGDGYDDVVLGTRVASGGSAYVFEGSPSGLGTTATTSVSDSTASYFGAALAVGDYNGDGYGDVAAGAYGSASAFVYPGSATGLSASPDSTLAEAGGVFGNDVAAADVDGDGDSDLVVGDYADSTGFGQAHVYHGYGDDFDGDGYSTSAGDCDDTDASINPAATEISFDGIDQDCDGAETCYADADNDGQRSTAGTTVASTDSDCSDAGEAGLTAPATDCLDTDATIYDGAPEVVADGIDQDCNGGDTCHVDTDGDSYGDDASVRSINLSCADAGEADDADDCDDSDAGVNPAAAETCDVGQIDEDCDGDNNEETATGAVAFYKDVDGDSYGDASTSTLMCFVQAGFVADGTDCDDVDADENPGATEVCGDPDVNCNGVTDDDDPRITGTSDWTKDADGDGYGDDTLLLAACSAPSGYSGTGGDCDDSDAAVNPTARDTIADGIDQDCDGGDVCWVDADADGARGTTTTASADLDCADLGEAEDSADSDCDDTDADVYPGATEVIADLVDQNCDGFESCYADADGDSHGSGDTVLSADADCAGPGEADSDDGDCDDADASVHPGELEVTGDEIDQDCDGQEYCYEDADSDGYRPDSFSEVQSVDTDCTDAGEALAGAPDGDCDDGDTAYNPGATEADCTDPGDYNCDGSTGYDDDDDDGWAACEECDDGDAGVNPDATETVGDSVDANCDGAETCFADADADGVRPDDTATVESADALCTDPGEAMGSAPIGDCDDADASVCPGATELPSDGVDQDCDGSETCYADADDDGWRDDATVSTSADADCDDAGEADATAALGDCDDQRGDIHPGASEPDCTDATDYNCDGSAGGTDADGDGFAACEECDDSLANVNPSEDEVCNDIDDDCSGVIDDDPVDADLRWWDSDGDGYGDRNAPIFECGDTIGTVANDDDCDDARAGISPAATDVPDDGIDQDCSGADATGLDDTDGQDTDGQDTGGQDTDSGPRTGGVFGGCSAAPGSAGVGAVFLGALVTVKRRRSRC